MSSRLASRVRSGLSGSLGGVSALLERDEATGRREDGRIWLAVAMGIAATIAVVYVLTHPYPALGGGLFLAIAERILAESYRLPVTIPHYTDGGIPFAYPPLLFYGLALLLDIGVPPLSLARVLPAIATVLYLVPFYYLSRELLGSVRRAGLATVLFAVTPAVLEWHLSAGGVIRAPALLVTLTGLYCGVRLFRTRDRRWLGPSTALFALTVLSHPIDVVFFGFSYLLFYAAYDRSLGGLVRGAIVAVGGVVLAAPWWLRVVAVHGVGPFVSAAGTHGGFGGGFTTTATDVAVALPANLPMWPWYLLVGLGGAVLLWRREFLLPAWFASVLVLTNKPRFAFVPGAMIAAAFVVAAASRSEDGLLFGPLSLSGRLARTLLAGVVCLLVVSGGVYASGGGTPLVNDGSLPSYLDDDDDAAMAWTAAETPTDATFVVVGDAAEWFPYLTDRTMLVGPWGVEWIAPERYTHQRALFRAVSTCDTAGCLSDAFGRGGFRPQYVYVPTDAYTVERREHARPDELIRSLVASNDYRLAYENDGVSIFRVTGTNG